MGWTERGEGDRVYAGCRSLCWGKVLLSLRKCCVGLLCWSDLDDHAGLCDQMDCDCIRQEAIRMIYNVNRMELRRADVVT